LNCLFFVQSVASIAPSKAWERGMKCNLQI
jgi:hypothetical protein